VTISQEDQALIEREATAHAHLASHEIPKAVGRVNGCNCGGTEWHRAASPWSSEPACSIWDLDREQYLANIDDANERLIAYCAETTRLNNLHRR
jgi:hypothetical protein